MPQPDPTDTTPDASQSSDRGDGRRTAALAAVGGLTAVVATVLLLGGGGEGEQHPVRPAAPSLPAWRHGEVVVPASWALAATPSAARSPRRFVPRPAVAAPAPAPFASAPHAAAPVATPVAPGGSMPLPPEPGEDFNWQR